MKAQLGVETMTQAHDVSGLAWHPDGDRILIATREYVDDERRDSLVLANLFTGEIEGDRCWRVADRDCFDIAGWL